VLVEKMTPQALGLQEGIYLVASLIPVQTVNANPHTGMVTVRLPGNRFAQVSRDLLVVVGGSVELACPN